MMSGYLKDKLKKIKNGVIRKSINIVWFAVRFNNRVFALVTYYKRNDLIYLLFHNSAYYLFFTLTHNILELTLRYLAIPYFHENLWLLNECGIFVLRKVTNVKLTHLC